MFLLYLEVYVLMELAVNLQNQNLHQFRGKRTFIDDGMYMRCNGWCRPQGYLFCVHLLLCFLMDINCFFFYQGYLKMHTYQDSAEELKNTFKNSKIFKYFQQYATCQLDRISQHTFFCYSCSYYSFRFTYCNNKVPQCRQRACEVDSAKTTKAITNIYIYIYTYIHTQTHTDAYIYIYTYIYIYIHTYIHTNIHIYTYTYIYIYICICIYTFI